MRRAEAAAKTIWLEMETVGQDPEEVTVTTRGSLRVLRGEHPAVHTVVEYEFANGLKGRMESARTADGVNTIEDNPTFGQTWTHIDAETAADLEWAGEVLQREQVPGLADGRAQAPLGSAMVADLARTYDLQPLPRRDRQGQEGMWLGGALRPGLQPEADADVPLGDRVELFVRNPDQALLEVVLMQGTKTVLRIAVSRVEIDRPMTEESFKIDGKALRRRELREQTAAWEQVQRTLTEAEAKAGKDAAGNPILRPSLRKK
jgi:hypothetical protein